MADSADTRDEMIFGGHGRKVKTRGEVFFPCVQCSALNPFALVENYGYGQLYGVRIAKFSTNRYLVCAHCRDGFGLDKAQWDQALAIANGLKARKYELSMSEMAESAVSLAQRVFPDLADNVRSMLWEQLGDPPPIEASQEEPEGTIEQLAASGEELKTCPDCAEEVKAAARKCRFCGYVFEADHASARNGEVELSD
jgi:Uncharacterised protein family UPF0547